MSLVKNKDHLWLVGGRISNGMKLEMMSALESNKIIIDLTAVGAAPPSDPVVVATLREFVAEALRIAAEAPADRGLNLQYTFKEGVGDQSSL